jgi:hypothetical protein
MIVETLFVYLPTIIAITIAFFVGIGIGFLIVAACLYVLVQFIPSFRQALVDLLKKKQINKES